LCGALLGETARHNSITACSSDSRKVRISTRFSAA
jgi:hypothetical protein